MVELTSVPVARSESSRTFFRQYDRGWAATPQGPLAPPDVVEQVTLFAVYRSTRHGARLRTGKPKAYVFLDEQRLIRTSE
jgi:hypothetical protein